MALRTTLNITMSETPRYCRLHWCRTWARVVELPNGSIFWLRKVWGAGWKSFAPVSRMSLSSHPFTVIVPSCSRRSRTSLTVALRAILDRPCARRRSDRAAGTGGCSAGPNQRMGPRKPYLAVPVTHRSPSYRMKLLLSPRCLSRWSQGRRRSAVSSDEGLGAPHSLGGLPKQPGPLPKGAWD